MSQLLGDIMYTIKSLNLTERGFALLAQYPSEALQYADSVMMGVGVVKDPFGYFVGIAKRYCSDKGLSTDYGITLRLMTAYQISPESPALENNAINKPSTKKASPSYPSVGYDLDAVKARIQQRNADYAEQLKESDPEGYARYMGRVQTMQNVLGIDSEGNVLDESNPPTPAKFLSGLSYISSGDFKVNVCSFKEKEMKEVKTPPTPPAEFDNDYQEILDWWNNTHLGSFKASSMFARIDKQLKSDPTPDLINSIKLIKSNWPPHQVGVNQNQP